MQMSQSDPGPCSGRSARMESRAQRAQVHQLQQTQALAPVPETVPTSRWQLSSTSPLAASSLSSAFSSRDEAAAAAEPLPLATTCPVLSGKQVEYVQPIPSDRRFRSGAPPPAPGLSLIFSQAASDPHAFRQWKRRVSAWQTRVAQWLPAEEMGLVLWKPYKEIVPSFHARFLSAEAQL